MEWHDVPLHGGQFSVAGYNFIGQPWNDVEKGGPELSGDDLGDVGRLTYHYVNPDTGDDIYYTIHGPFDDWESLASIIDAELDHYLG